MNLFESARNIAHVLLSKYDRKDLSPDLIAAEVENVFLMPSFDRSIKEELISQLEADFEIYSSEATQLVSKEIKPWLSDNKASINWELWNRYRSYVKAKDASFPVDHLDDLTDKILDSCANPKSPGSWDRRGMVVGNVQSGKTANYAGLINKATDAGYKLIIVIAGIHNTLRSQTQVRIDEGYIGRNSADLLLRGKTNRIGVGNFKVDTEIYSYTSSDEKGDFNKGIATKLNVPIGGKSPTVLVIKKNKSVLENLILWLNQFAVDDSSGNRKIRNVPVLVIDDEADNASVNSGTEIDVKTINRLIRTLLNLFNQNTFIGYTATPYANLFIPTSWSDEFETMVKDVRLKVGEDLFPRDFIINIPPPSNYIGAAQVFGFDNDKTGELYEGLDIIRLVNDQEGIFLETTLDSQGNERQRIPDELPDDVPSSLKNALKSFILTCAIRRLRGQEKKHNSMLVHVALRVAWIDRIAWLVNEILRDYKMQIKSGQGTLMSELEALYKNDFISTTKEVVENLKYTDSKIQDHLWDDMKSELLNASSKIEVRAVHGTRNTRNLEYHNIEEINYGKYENGLSVIAVGGNKLARGITLEGLSVSYYLRTTRMYDSLMQMGRWFGYRPGYVDLCRLFTTEDLVGWYRHVTMATEEMRADFDELAAKNMRPEDFRLKVRTHSGMLTITSLTKMRDHEKIQLSFSGDVKQTFEFDNNQVSVDSNFKLLHETLRKLKAGEIQSKSTVLWKDVNSDIILEFLDSYKLTSDKIRLDLIRDYIARQNQSGIFRNWSVAVKLTSSSTVRSLKKEGKHPLHDHPTFFTDLSFVDSKLKKAGVAFRDLREDIKELSTKGSSNAILDKASRIVDLDVGIGTDEKEIKKQRKEKGTPLLVLMPLDPRVSKKLRHDTPLLGFGIIFPELENESKFEYAARPLQNQFEVIPQEDDDTDGDD
jgi:hypothetical protein